MQDAFLYVFLDDQIYVYPGFIRDDLSVDWSFVPNNETRHKPCSSKPEVIFKNTLWLTSRNDQLARELFIADQNKKMTALRHKINTCNSVLFKIKACNIIEKN